MKLLKHNSTRLLGSLSTEDPHTADKEFSPIHSRHINYTVLCARPRKDLPGPQVVHT